MHYSPFNEVNHIVELLLQGTQRIFSRKMEGFYLYGSLVYGDFDIVASDIDTLCVTTSEVTLDELKDLQQMHETIIAEYPHWQNRIEVHYAPSDGLQHFREKSFQMANISPGEPLHMIDAGIEWIDEWYCVREYAVTLLGTNPKNVIPPITKDEFIQTVCGYAQSFQERIKTCKESCYSQAYAILTVCRALYTLKNGEQTSKPAAARWAINFLPEYSELINNALIWRHERNAEVEKSLETYILAEQFVNDIVKRFF